MDVTLQHREMEISSYAQTKRAKEVNRLIELDNLIESSIENIQASYIAVAQALSALENENLIYSYRIADEYGNMRSINSIEEYAYCRFGMSKTTVTTALGIYKIFCDGNGCLNTQFNNYSYSQLAELLPLCKTKEGISISNLPTWVGEEIVPETTVKEIRTLKKLHKEKRSKVLPPAIPVNIDEPGEPKEDDVLEKYSSSVEPTYFKNDEERKAFVSAYRDWSVFARNEFLGLTYYRCPMSMGIYLIAIDWTNTHRFYAPLDFKDCLKYIYRPNTEFHLEPLADGLLVDLIRTEKLMAYFPKKEECAETEVGEHEQEFAS